MPRHHRAAGAPSGRALTSAAISTLVPPVLQIIPAAAPAPRRRLPKHIPILESTPVSSVIASSRRSRSNSAGLQSSLRSGLGEFGAKVSGPSLPVVRAGATFLSTLSTSVALSASLYPPSNPASAPSSPYLLPIGSSGRIGDSSYAVLTADAGTGTGTGAASESLAPSAFLLAGSMAGSESEASKAAAPTTLPSLDFVAATDEGERTAGLKLVADSIAQRRQLASYALMTHPFFLGLIGLVFSAVYKYLYKVPGDGALVFTTCAGILMAGFVGIRAAVSPYITLAETVNYAWFGSNGDMVIARWGDGEDRKVIGALVYTVEKQEGTKGGKKGKKAAFVRAWTTRQRERGKGVGRGLVEEMVKVVQARGIDDIRWQDGNLYETRILPTWANGGFEDGLKACRQKLEAYITEYSRK